MTVALTLPLVIAALVLLTSKFKVTPFLALLTVSIGAGFALGMEGGQVVKSVQKGLGDMLGGITILLAAGAMLGKLVAESGAGMAISERIMGVFGQKYLQWGLMLTGLAVGIPLFYNVGFVLVLPIIFGLVERYRLPVTYVAIPVLAALSVAHSLLPPHPSPASLVSLFQADMATTFGLGLLVALPAIIVAGPVFSATLKKDSAVLPPSAPPDTTFASVQPDFGISLFSALLPVFLMAITAVLGMAVTGNPAWEAALKFVGEPTILMLVSLAIAAYTLGPLQGRPVAAVMKIYETGVQDIAMILLVIGASGVLKQVLVDTKTSDALAAFFQGLQLHPLVLGWLMAALIRISLGSATVAGMTAAGIIAPMMPALQTNPNLMVLAIGAGSIFCSHVNDTGFWMFKSYFNLSIKDTFRSWTLMESIVSVVGLAGVLILDIWI